VRVVTQLCVFLRILFSLFFTAALDSLSVIAVRLPVIRLQQHEGLSLLSPLA